MTQAQQGFHDPGQYHAQVPYIEDPNTGTAMFESTKIIQYLNDTYAVK